MVVRPRTGWLGLSTVALCCGWLMLALPSLVSASALELHWKAPKECPAHAEVERGILAVLPEPVQRVPAGSIVVTIEVERQRDGAFAGHVRVHVGDAASQRTFSGRACQGVTQAAILIAALSVDPVHVAALLPVPRAPVRVRLGAAARVAGDVGSLPSISAGAGVALSLRVDRVSLVAEGMMWLPRLALESSDQGRGAEVGLGSGALRTCVDAWRGRHAALAPCAEVELGALRGRGVNLEHPRTARALWAAVGLGAALRHSVESGLFLELQLDALLGVRRPIFFIDDVGSVFRSQRFAGRLAMLVGFHFL